MQTNGNLSVLGHFPSPCFVLDRFLLISLERAVGCMPRALAISLSLLPWESIREIVPLWLSSMCFQCATILNVLHFFRRETEAFYFMFGVFQDLLQFPVGKLT